MFNNIRTLPIFLHNRYKSYTCKIYYYTAVTIIEMFSNTFILLYDDFFSNIGECVQCTKYNLYLWSQYGSIYPHNILLYIPYAIRLMNIWSYRIL